MSRTYRRNKEKAPDWVTRNWDFSFTGFHWLVIPLEGKEAKKSISKWHSDAGYHGDYGDCPKWFNKLYHIIPERREAKRLQHKVLKLEDYEDAPEFPLCHGRTEYFW
jgi:hypothetical protein